MARISGVDLPKNKRIEIALTYIYGIGRTSACLLYTSEVRGKRPPEPYKGKGIKYTDEVIRRKEGKTGVKK